MDILSFVNAARNLIALLAWGIDTGELAAFLVLLHRRTGNRTIGAKHAAIARKRLQSRAAAFAVIEELAGVGRHGLNRLLAAFRAGKRCLQLHQRLVI
jgi:superfamily I DNA/RNA helicase